MYAHALLRLDRELSELHNMTCALRTRRNVLVPIARLPFEILAHIFALVASESVPRPYTTLHASHTGASGSLGWIVVTHVCRQWRAVAMNSPWLWANCVCALPVAVCDLLVRSRNVPIIVSHDLGRYRVKHGPLKAIKLTLTQISRVKVLQLCIDEDSLDALTKTQLATPAPLLTSLEISLSADVRLSFLHRLASLPPNIFAGEAPRLRRVSLVNCTIPWTSGILTGLTHIEIRLQSLTGPVEALPTSDQIFTVLGHCPELQELVLVETLPESGPTREQLYLPRLQRLVLSDKALSCAHFFQNISIPPGATLELSCTSLGPSAQFCLPLLSHVQSLARTLPRLVITSDRTSCLRLQYFPMDFLGADPRETGVARPLLDINLFCSDPRPAIYIDTLCSSIPFKEVRFLELEIPEKPALEPDQWAVIFGLAPLIQDVIVRGTSTAHGVLWALGTSHDILPLLTSLTLKGVEFSSDAGADDESLVEACGAFLEAYAGHGVSVRIVECTVCPEVFSELEQLSFTAGIDMLWDGKECGVKVVREAENTDGHYGRLGEEDEADYDFDDDVEGESSDENFSDESSVD